MPNFTFGSSDEMYDEEFDCLYREEVNLESSEDEEEYDNEVETIVIDEDSATDSPDAPETAGDDQPELGGGELQHTEVPPVVNRRDALQIRKKSNYSRKRKTGIYQCEQCNRSYSLPYYLRQHQLVHSEVRPFRCPLCPKSFKSASHLKHHRLAHSTERAHCCTTCNVAFKQVSHLYRHQQTVHHSISSTDPRVKAHQCTLCSKCFTRPEHLKRHQLRLHVKGVQVMEYRCTACSRVFNRSNGLTKHQRANPSHRNDN